LSHEKNAVSLCCAKVEITLFSFDNFHSQVHRITEDDLLRLFRQDPVASRVAKVRFVPIEFNPLPSLPLL
jgi:hypothetical protein